MIFHERKVTSFPQNSQARGLINQHFNLLQPLEAPLRNALYAMFAREGKGRESEGGEEGKKREGVVFFGGILCGLPVLAVGFS